MEWKYHEDGENYAMRWFRMNTIHLVIAVAITDGEQVWQDMFRVSGDARANISILSKNFHKIHFLGFLAAGWKMI